MSVAVPEALQPKKPDTVHPAEQGQSYPLGATLAPGGDNFSLYSCDAADVELLLFNRHDDPRPVRTIQVNPAYRTYHYWHAFVPGIQAGQIYGGVPGA